MASEEQPIDAQPQRSPIRVLVTGGTGYIGQHLLQRLSGDGACVVGYTYSRQPLPHLDSVVPSFQMDLTNAATVEAALREFGPEVIVHCAAKSSPKDCETSEEEAVAAVNCPVCLVDAAASLASPPLLIFLSTDQVFSGKEAPYAEESPVGPVNQYGKSKLAFENLLLARYPCHVILRTSNVLGPPAPFTGATKFFQWLEDQLQSDSAVTLFHDEVRSFVHVVDVLETISSLLSRWHSTDEFTVGVLQAGCTFHLGGSASFSRLGLAEALVEAKGYPTTMPDGSSKLIPVARAELSEKMGYESPLDISMDSSKLEAFLGFFLRSALEAAH
mmetsp:Transcript_30146/g.87806  ORF Transcript_30146/g.87806 Transcript_30146/m.87806 type:complete len:330 (-) Transcript_30146:253-1242(-)